jgi:hypothetical protein
MAACRTQILWSRRAPLLAIAASAMWLAVPTRAVPSQTEQTRGRGRGEQVAQTPRAAAPIDLTGYWVSVVTEDWRFRMVTPPRGNYGGVPLTAEGRRVADSWDPAKDEAAGEQCKSYGAAGLMRVPGHLHVTWQDDSTLRIEADAGTQTRLLYFGGAPQGGPAGAGEIDATWQGYSVAEWETAAAGRGKPRAGTLKVVTTRMRPGYLRKNGVPYSGNAVLTEYYDRITTPAGDDWLIVLSEVKDPRNLTQPFVTTTHFRKRPGASGWSPEPCTAR